MHERVFKQVDVFSPTPYYGNALGVVLDGQGLSDADMQRFASWTQLSETTFLLPPTQPQADYRVRIFTAQHELPFAGHPTLGSAHAWLQAGGQAHQPGLLVQECAQGLVNIRVETDTGRLALAAPPLQRSPVAPALLAQVSAALRLAPAQVLAAQHLDNGPHWLALLLDSPETVLQLTPDLALLTQLGTSVGVASRYAASPAPQLIGRANREARAFGTAAGSRWSAADDWQADFEVRAFVPAEDPVTGSLNASLAQWLMADRYAPMQYSASQGVCLGRAGQVHLARDAQGQVWVGGACVTCIEGRVLL